MKIQTVLAFILSINCLYSQNTVYVNVPGGNEGRGILKSREGECFVIVPNHVVKDYDLDKIGIIGEKKVKSFASVEHPYKEDLAILRIESGGTQKCTEWNVEVTYANLIDNNTSGFVEYRESDGSVQKAEVEIIGATSEDIQIQKKDAMSVFMKGWSGSSFFVTNNGVRTYMGMLYEIEGRKGHVMRADHMFNVMTSFFGKTETASQNDVVKDNSTFIGNFNASSGILRELETKQVKLAITKFEQNNNKAIFHFTLTNKNAAQQSVEFHTHINYFNLIDQNGLSYKASNILIGNDNDRTELIYNVPVACSVEFEVGMNKITKAAKLQLNGYYFEFKFFNIDLMKVEEKKVSNEIKGNKILGTQANKLIYLDVTGFEQNNNKAVFHYTLTNKNSAQQSIEFHTHLNYFKLIDQNGLSYEASQIQIGNDDDRAELIYNVPVACRAEFEVGMNKITKAAKLQLNGYYFEFIFINLDLTYQSKTTQQTKSINIPTSGVNSNIGSMDLENVRLKINAIEQIGTKLIFHYSYENIDRTNQIKKIQTHIDYNKIKMNGSEFKANYVSIGSGQHDAELIYQVPVPCFAEFDIGSIQPTQIESLKLGLYYYDFEFVGTGPIGTEKSLKSMKAIQDRNELIGTGIKLGLDLLTKKKN